MGKLNKGKDSLNNSSLHNCAMIRNSISLFGMTIEIDHKISKNLVKYKINFSYALYV